VRIIGRLGVVIFGAAEWSLAELNTQQLARGINNVTHFTSRNTLVSLHLHGLLRISTFQLTKTTQENKSGGKGLKRASMIDG